MQYVVNLRQVLSCQRHVCDGRNRFLNNGPVWAILHQRLVIERSNSPIQFQRIMSTDVLHEVHPRGSHFPVSGDDW
jgi:hypothetical protein